MSTQSGHNISLSKSKFGCRFPFENPDVGDGYATSSPVVSRQMTPEERAKYGPVKARRQKLDNRLSAEKINGALLIASSAEEAAEILQVHPQRLKLKLSELKITPPWKEARADGQADS